MGPKASHNVRQAGYHHASHQCYMLYLCISCMSMNLTSSELTLELHNQALTKKNKVKKSKTKTPRPRLSTLGPHTVDWYSSTCVFPGILSC